MPDQNETDTKPITKSVLAEICLDQTIFLCPG